MINATGGSPTVWSNNGSSIGFTVRGHDYVAYAPTGATWTVSGSRISSNLAGRGYFKLKRQIPELLQGLGLDVPPLKKTG